MLLSESYAAYSAVPRVHKAPNADSVANGPSVIAGTSGSFALHDRIMPALVLPGDVQLASSGEHQRAKDELARSRSKHEARECTPEPWSSASVPDLRSHQSTQCASHVQPFFFHGRLYCACSRTSDGGCKNISIVGSCIPASVRLRGHGLLSVSFFAYHL